MNTKTEAAEAKPKPRVRRRSVPNVAGNATSVDRRDFDHHLAGAPEPGWKDPRTLQDSPFQPRRSYNEASLAELAGSITATKGLLQPIVVRPVPDGLEIVCGHRRKRAAILAGLELVRVEERELDDAAVITAALAENSQRDDVPPLDEAHALGQLVELGVADVEELAARVGHSAGWVRTRLRCLDLVEPLRELLGAHRFPLRSVPVLAALPEARQLEVAACFREQIWRPSWTHHDVVREVSGRARRLDGAAWELDDEDLGGWGACTGCRFRSALQPGLFEDEADRCLDQECWGQKTQASVERLRATGCTILDKRPNYGSGFRRADDICWEYRDHRPEPEPDAAATEPEPEPVDCCRICGRTDADGGEAGLDWLEPGLCEDCEAAAEALDGATSADDATWGDLAPDRPRAFCVENGRLTPYVREADVAEACRASGRETFAEYLEQPRGEAAAGPPAEKVSQKECRMVMGSLVKLLEADLRLASDPDLLVVMALCMAQHAARKEVAARRGWDVEKDLGLPTVDEDGVRKVSAEVLALSVSARRALALELLLTESMLAYRGWPQHSMGLPWKAYLEVADLPAPK